MSTAGVWYRHKMKLQAIKKPPPIESQTRIEMNFWWWGAEAHMENLHWLSAASVRKIANGTPYKSTFIIEDFSLVFNVKYMATFSFCIFQK